MSEEGEGERCRRKTRRRGNEERGRSYGEREEGREVP